MSGLPLSLFIKVLINRHSITSFGPLLQTKSYVEIMGNQGKTRIQESQFHYVVHYCYYIVHYIVRQTIVCN